jgi:methionyl-tRNA formyltransferase
MLMAGDAQTGVAIMQTVAELDAGPLISLDPIAVGNEADTETIEQEALRLGVPALVRAIEAAAAGTLDAEAQATDGTTYAAKLERTDRLIDPSLHTVVDTLNRIRALRPQIGALLTLDGETFTIWRATAATVKLAPGACVAVGDELQVGCADGAIAISELQTAGKRALSTPEWLRGRRDLPTSASCPV